ncbi:MAG: rhodanese-like domain-containing protein [Candidatus Brocadiia bacterium]
MEKIGAEELRERINDNGPLAIVDVLHEDAYEAGHLPGAINVPLDDDFNENIQTIVPQKDRTVVVYCANRKCPASPKAAMKMEKLGYTDVIDFEAGKAGWKKQGYEFET